MMIMSKVYINTEGILIKVETGIDLSGATKVSLKVRKPSGTEVEWIGTADGTKITYITQTGDLDEAGLYKIQAYIEKGSLKILGDTDGIYVYNEFE